jgi:hypothetical protein
VLGGLTTAQPLLWDPIGALGTWTPLTWNLSAVSRAAWQGTNWQGTDWQGTDWQGTNW